MATDPLTSSRYPVSGDAVTLWTYFQNAVSDLSDNTVTGPFADATARDSAFASWVASGGTMRRGLLASITGSGVWEYNGSTWLPHRGLVASPATLSTTHTSAGTTEERVTALTSSGLSLVSGNSYEVWAIGRMWPSVADVVHTLRVRASGSGTPTTSSTAVLSHQVVRSGNSSGAAPDFKVMDMFAVQTTGTFSIAAFITCASGTASVGTDARSRAELFVKDCGPAQSGLVTVV